MLKRTSALIIAAIMLFTISAFAADSVTVSGFAKTCNKNGTLAFTAADFTSNSNVTSDTEENPVIDKIKVTDLPETDKGILNLESTPITAGDEIAAADFAKINFVAATDITGTATFKWRGMFGTVNSPGKATVTITIEEPPPVKPVANAQSIVVTKNTAKNGTLTGSDAGGKTLTFAKASDPAHGNVTITAETGAFTYTPDATYAGTDFFTFKVNNGETDSDAATVSITIEEPEPELFDYADMKTHWAAYSAGMLGTMGKIIGEKIGGKYYFRPDMEISRGDFILFVAELLSIPESTIETPYFVDDVPDYLVKISNKFHDEQIINGVEVGTGKYELRPHQTITKLEAFKILSLALELETAPNVTLTFSDKADIPAWGLEFVKNLVAYQVVEGSTSGKLSPGAKINRGQAAQLVYKAYLEKQKP